MITRGARGCSFNLIFVLGTRAEALSQFDLIQQDNRAVNSFNQPQRQSINLDESIQFIIFNCDHVWVRNPVNAVNPINWFIAERAEESVNEAIKLTHFEDLQKFFPLLNLLILRNKHFYNNSSSAGNIV